LLSKAETTDNLYAQQKEFGMNKGIKTVIYPVKDTAQAKALFSKLFGVEPHVDGPYYVGYKVGDQELGLSPSPYGYKAGMTGPIAYHHVDDIKQSLKLILDAGGKELQPIKDVGGGMLIASATDADGNVIGLVQQP